MRTFDLDDLHILNAVITHGGIAKAAYALHRVPSNVTTRIKQLEKRLGVELFMKRGRSIVPTEEAYLLNNYAKRLLRLADEAEAAVRCRSPIGTLRIGSLESTASSRLPDLLARFHQANPDVRFELITGPTDRMIGRLARYDIEAAFVSEPFHAPGTAVSEPMFQEELVLITAKNIDCIASLKRLQTITLISFTNGCSYRKLLEQWHSANCQGVSNSIEFASYPAIVACVAAGTGISFVPRSVLSGLQSSHSVKAHRLPEPYATNTTHLIWHETQESLALKSFRQFIKQAQPMPSL